MQPLVLVDGEYSASLDGITLGGERLLEIKCPVKGRDSTLWQTVEVGRLPEHYECQVQHQLMVTGAEVADVYVFDGSEGLLLEVNPQTDTWRRIREGWDRFAEYVAMKTPPPLAKGDTVERNDPAWAEAAAAYVSVRRSADEVLLAVDEAKARLLALATHTSESGGGVTVTRYWKRGAIDYKQVPQLAGVALEQYRSAPKEETRISLR